MKEISALLPTLFWAALCHYAFAQPSEIENVRVLSDTSQYAVTATRSKGSTEKSYSYVLRRWDREGDCLRLSQIVQFESENLYRSGYLCNGLFAMSNNLTAQIPVILVWDFRTDRLLEDRLTFLADEFAGWASYWHREEWVFSQRQLVLLIGSRLWTYEDGKISFCALQWSGGPPNWEHETIDLPVSPRKVEKNRNRPCK